MRHPEAVVLAGLLVFTGGCGCNLLVDPESRATALPASADVAVGATHDLLVVACQDKVTLTDLLLPTVATAFFVGAGRLDAAFYYPDAVAKSVAPKCETVPYTVSGATLEGDAFELEPTPNPGAFKAHARQEGESIFRAQVTAGGETLEVTSTLRAWKADRVTFAPRCGSAPAGTTVLAGYVPAGGTAEFEHQLFHGSTLLAGYGYYGVDHPRLTLSDGSRGSVWARVGAERGPFTVTSEVDPSFALRLTAWDVNDFDPPILERVTNELLFAGQTTVVRPRTTLLGGQTPCVWGFVRTVTVETPAVCRFKDLPDTSSRTNQGNTPVTLEAVAPGNCRVTVTVPDSTQTASVDIPVFRGFEQLAALPTEALVPAIGLQDVWVASLDEATFVGAETDVSGWSRSVTLRRVGGAWGRLQSAQKPRWLQAVHGSLTGGGLFAVGKGGTGTSWNGGAWIPFDAGTPADLEDVWVNAANDVYAVGGKGAFVHFDGAQWSAIDAGVSSEIRSVWGDGAGAVYAVGWNSTALRWNGSSLGDALPPGFLDAGFSANDVSGSGPSDVWIAANKQVLHFDGVKWTSHPFATQPNEGVVGVWSTGDGYAYVLVVTGIGSSLPAARVDRFDGTRTVSIPVPGAGKITGVGNEVIVHSRGQLLRYHHDPADVFP